MKSNTLSMTLWVCLAAILFASVIMIPSISNGVRSLLAAATVGAVCGFSMELAQAPKSSNSEDTSAKAYFSSLHNAA